MYEPYDPVIGLVYLVLAVAFAIAILTIFITITKSTLAHHIVTHYSAVIDNKILPVHYVLHAACSPKVLPTSGQVFTCHMVDFDKSEYAVIYYRHDITFLWVWFFHKRKHLFRTSQLRYTHPEYFI